MGPTTGSCGQPGLCGRRRRRAPRPRSSGGASGGCRGGAAGGCTSSRSAGRRQNSAGTPSRRGVGGEGGDISWTETRTETRSDRGEDEIGARHPSRRAGRAKATRTETRIETRIQSQARLETRRRRLGWGRTRMSAADTDTSLQSVTARTSTSTPHSPPHLQPPPPTQRPTRLQALRLGSSRVHERASRALPLGHVAA